jgi:23S rRNA (cytidine2498-2'-O)-methyltransferase
MTHPPVYLAPRGHERELERELGPGAVLLGERLYALAGPEREACWAQNVWREPRVIPIDSITDGARKLRALQRNWVLHPLASVRRARLIEARLPKIAVRPRTFPCALPTAPLGAFTLLGPDRLLAAPKTQSPFPHGELHFVEDRQGPPSRAYLKLWEALTWLGEQPGAGELCLDLGASPGGWSFALAALGAEVLSVDKAPLDADVAALSNVTVLRESAFALEPASIGAIDWLFSDVICYPERLLTLVERWLGHARRIVCTIKLQGEPRPDVIARFAAIEGARVRHLFHNRHELTFAWASHGLRTAW